MKMKSLPSVILFTLTLLLANQTLLLAQQNRLPKVGAVESKETGAGCSFWLPGSQSKKSIFVDVGTPLMNFDSRDAILKKVSNRTSGKTTTTIYTAGDLRIQIGTRWIGDYPNEPNTKATIKLTQNGRSKVIKAVGYCGC
jgi:hypothetical protein